MDTISISEFEATCLAVIDRVRRTGLPVQITLRGEPVAELIAPRASQPIKRRVLGRLRDELSIDGDVMAPVMAEAEWTATSSPASPGLGR
jgi:prevent-host-death family protein